MNLNYNDSETHDEVSYATKKARRLWNIAMFSPLLYLMIAWILERNEIVDTSPDSKHPWDTSVIQGALIVLLCLIGAMLVWLRIARVSQIRMNLDNRMVVLTRWTRNFFLMAAISDVLGVLGLIYFMISGEKWAVLAGGVAAYLGYLLAYPRASELDPLTKRVG